jgi:hypothetical protein
VNGSHRLEDDMRKVMLLAVAVAALPCLAIAADEELAGTYTH